MIYVLHVQSGKEQEIVRKLGELDIQSFAPTHELLERRNGKWNTVQRIIFPGYVFVSLDKLAQTIYYIVKSVDSVIRFLGQPPEPLRQEEADRLQWIFNAGNMTVSRGYVKDGRLHITDGILSGREHRIIKYSRRRKRCTLCCEINGRRHFFDVSAELDKV
ncbi:transcription termination/antitermination NusG family protein [Ruminococcus sp. Marseille-P6503]|uniref:transcription termination/antitermination NusG family protein n=1 Tax=Ruminococcus sp. Marseille-P6503 TaxID=2364796 RepID=UPI000F5398E7|nr:transcription termination/antitermination NusG family protein [Ruminococcus sp. Marseille-P6503]